MILLYICLPDIPKSNFLYIIFFLNKHMNILRQNTEENKTRFFFDFFFSWEKRNYILFFFKLFGYAFFLWSSIDSDFFFNSDEPFFCFFFFDESL